MTLVLKQHSVSAIRSVNLWTYRLSVDGVPFRSNAYAYYHEWKGKDCYQSFIRQTIVKSIYAICWWHLNFNKKKDIKVIHGRLSFFDKKIKFKIDNFTDRNVHFLTFRLTKIMQASITCQQTLDSRHIFIVRHCGLWRQHE